jgi:hypothetical protein
MDRPWKDVARLRPAKLSNSDDIERESNFWTRLSMSGLGGRRLGTMSNGRVVMRKGGSWGHIYIFGKQCLGQDRECSCH